VETALEEAKSEEIGKWKAEDELITSHVRHRRSIHLSADKEIVTSTEKEKQAWTLSEHCVGRAQNMMNGALAQIAKAQLPPRRYDFPAIAESHGLGGPQ